MAKRQANNAQLRFALVLQHFLLQLIGYRDFEELRRYLSAPDLEGYDEEGVSRFCTALQARLPKQGGLTKEDLIRYDSNIRRHTAHINEEREQKIVWKYFQYVALLFSEIYLDRYFNGKEALLSQLNAYLLGPFGQRNDSYADFSAYTEQDLNKVALWTATGSGKTLLMHVNILQYLHYAKAAKQKYNRILLVTPNEGLTKQHLGDFRMSNIDAIRFSKQGGRLFGDVVEIIEVTKLADKDGDETVAVDSFEDNNFVLIDEAHRGSSGKEWKDKRERLSRRGFSFEYSATLGQAVGAASAKDQAALLAEYAKSTLLDYSYRRFYSDGYGKEYEILNLSQTNFDAQLHLYLTASLLTFYEQTLAYRMKRVQIEPYLIEKPLAVFVGSSVNAVRTENKQQCSDVVTILRFLNDFISNPDLSRQNIVRLLQGTDGLSDADGNSIFANRFNFLKSQNIVVDFYADMLSKLFNSNVSGAQLHLDNLKGADGEIGLRVGTAEYFGVINVGDESDLIKLCAANGINTAERDFAGQSLFDSITSSSSTVNILIGSKKFNEGWNCWRVSTMGLMNIGRSQGTQVIQLFGRGVRLKGRDFSLKRAYNAASSADGGTSLPEGLGLLETLNIFGVRADYMEAFRDVLREEGLPVDKLVSIKLPVLPTIDLSGKKLKYIRVKEGNDFVKDVAVDLKPNMLRQASIKLDYYPRVQALHSRNVQGLSAGVPNSENFTQNHLRFIDWQAIYFDLLRFKRERQWWNLGINYGSLKAIMSDSSWYTLLIPADDMKPGRFAPTVALWQEIALTLLRMYTERAYNRCKAEWMSKNIETAILDQSNPNFMQEYSLRIHKDLTNIIQNIETLKDKLDKGEGLEDFTIGTDFEALYFSQHLYRPLLCFTGKSTNDDGELLVEIKPVALNQGEKQFVADLKTFYNNMPDFFQDKELYLLRNESRRGIGFFEANNFYPDFILWLVQGRKQHIAFIDPKGITHLKGFSNPKIRLAQLIRKDIEPRLNDKAITLNSYIVSNTALDDVKWWCGLAANAQEAQEIFTDYHIYFQQGTGCGDYVQSILADMLASTNRSS